MTATEDLIDRQEGMRNLAEGADILDFTNTGESELVVQLHISIGVAEKLFYCAKPATISFSVFGALDQNRKPVGLEPRTTLTGLSKCSVISGPFLISPGSRFRIHAHSDDPNHIAVFTRVEMAPLIGNSVDQPQR